MDLYFTAHVTLSITRVGVDKRVYKHLLTNHLRGKAAELF